MSEWISVERMIPKEKGRYKVKLIRSGEEIETEKYFVRNRDIHKWFGGCRPFCENDVVTHWMPLPPKP